MEEMHHHNSTSSDAYEYLKFFGVLAFIAGAAYVLYASLDNPDLSDYMRYFMGVFMSTFAAFKFAGYKMFVMMFAGYDIVAKRIKAYSYAFPFIELGLGLLFLLDIMPTTRNIWVILVMGLGSIGVIQEIYYRRSGVYCACLGNVIKLPLSSVSLFEDLAMVLMAAFMLTV